MQTKLKRAFLCYAQGFLAYPELADLILTIDETSIEAALLLAGPDLQMIDESPQLAGHLELAFVELSYHLDDTRTAFLWFDEIS